MIDNITGAGAHRFVGCRAGIGSLELAPGGGISANASAWCAFAGVAIIPSVAMAITLAVALVADFASWRVACGVAVQFWNISLSD